MTLSSDLASASDLNGLIAAIERNEDVVARVAERTRVNLIQVVNEQFATETDPDGKPWVSGPNYNGLIRTGAMLGSLDARVDGNEIEMIMDEPFIFHQGGTKNADDTPRMPQRKIFPYEEELPPTYQAAVDEAFEEVVGK